MTDLTLYGHPDSGHACKVAIALQLAGLPHDSVHVDIHAPRETRSEAFRHANPAGEVPVLVVDGTPYTQSGAILLEIAQRFGVLGGADQSAMTRARALIVWEANRIGMCLPQLIGGNLHPETAAWLTERYRIDRDRFDLYLGAEPFFHGPEPGIADCAIWGYVSRVRAAGMEPSAAMSDWLSRMQALPQMIPGAEMFPQ